MEKKSEMPPPTQSLCHSSTKTLTPVVTNKGIIKGEILGPVECRAEGT